MTTLDWNVTYMAFARTVALHSKSKKVKVGCVIVKDNQVISSGYNGTPHGYDNTCEDDIDGKYVTRDEVIHAEINAIAKVAKSTVSTNGAFLYVTKPPCFNCAKSIIASGVSLVVFEGTNDDCAMDSISFLQLNGVVVIAMQEDRYLH